MGDNWPEGIMLTAIDGSLYLAITSDGSMPMRGNELNNMSPDTSKMIYISGIPADGGGS
jgi:hypothetical protein